MSTQSISRLDRSLRRTRSRVIPLEKVPSRRLWWVFFILCTGLVGLIGRMAWLQLVQTADLEARARRLQTQKSQPLGQRRPIVDRNGRLVAMDEKRFRLWAHPRYFNFPGDELSHIRPPGDVAGKLAPVLAVPAQRLKTQLADRNSGIKLQESIDPETAASIRALGISGLDLEPYPQRIYPQGSLFANVVGFALVPTSWPSGARSSTSPSPSRLSVPDGPSVHVKLQSPMKELAPLNFSKRPAIGTPISVRMYLDPAKNGSA